MAGNPNIVELGKNTRFPINDPTKGGRRPSIKNEVNEMLTGQNNHVIWIDESKVVKRQVTKMIENTDGELEETQVTEYGLHLTSMEYVKHKISKFIKGKNDQLAWDVIKFIWEQNDGKARQPVDLAPDTGVAGFKIFRPGQGE